MVKKTLVGALVGGAIVFLVSGFLHMATRLGEYGIRTLPAEDAVMSAMRASIHEPGFYFFPGINMSSSMSKEQSQTEQTRYLDKFKEGPTGILIYKTGGQGFDFPRLLVVQFIIGLAAAFIVGWILATTAGATTYWTRFFIVLLLGLFAGMYINLPYWNWYGFPGNYMIAQILVGAASWGVAGLAMAAIAKKPSSA